MMNEELPKGWKTKGTRVERTEERPIWSLRVGRRPTRRRRVENKSLPGSWKVKEWWVQPISNLIIQVFQLRERPKLSIR